MTLGEALHCAESDADGSDFEGSDVNVEVDDFERSLLNEIETVSVNVSDITRVAVTVDESSHETRVTVPDIVGESVNETENVEVALFLVTEFRFSDAEGRRLDSLMEKVPLDERVDDLLRKHDVERVAESSAVCVGDTELELLVVPLFEFDADLSGVPENVIPPTDFVCDRPLIIVFD